MVTPSRPCSENSSSAASRMRPLVLALRSAFFEGFACGVALPVARRATGDEFVARILVEVFFGLSMIRTPVIHSLLPGFREMYETRRERIFPGEKCTR